MYPTSGVTAGAPRRRQAERRERTRNALLEAAARGLSRHGYSNLVLEDVAREAGYSRGALYHLFTSKEELALAVLAWVDETWWEEVGAKIPRDADPLDALRVIARAHAVYCRRDVARVMVTLRVEFSDRDHPVGRILYDVLDRLLADTARLIDAGRARGSIPPGPPAAVMALAVMGALEGSVIALAGQEPHDEVLAERAVMGVLGLSA